MKFLLETNVWVSAIFFDGNDARLLKRLGLQGHIIVLPEVVKTELHQFLKRRAALAGTLPPALPEELEGAKQDTLADGMGDDAVLRAAERNGVDFLVTGDRRLLHVRAYGTAAIVRTVDALRIIGVP